MQNQILKEKENFEKQLKNEVAEERGSRIVSVEGISKSLLKFCHDPDNSMTFQTYFKSVIVKYLKSPLIHPLNSSDTN